ncbi:hypothetical protein HPB47_002087 [Ixodes persulcatus]|uniref:Uncharacterized protein n=1 Tax=Ixodes persulcatus TaxID=34615 RepID=A0AC60PNR2_IXOPE|nr:hypothetical protein HPB47_002087 [Ixodes persulcatus]
MAEDATPRSDAASKAVPDQSTPNKDAVASAVAKIEGAERNAEKAAAEPRQPDPLGHDGGKRLPVSRHRLVLRTLVAIAALLATVAFLMSSLFLVQSLRTERHTARARTPVLQAAPPPEKLPVPWPALSREADERRTEKLRSRSRRRSRHARRRSQVVPYERVVGPAMQPPSWPAS